MRLFSRDVLSGQVARSAGSFGIFLVIEHGCVSTRAAVTASARD